MIRQLGRIVLLLCVAAMVLACVHVLERGLPERREFQAPKGMPVPRFRKKREPQVVAALPQLALQVGLIGAVALAGRRWLGLRLTD